MKRHYLSLPILLLSLSAAGSAQAAIFNATSSNLQRVFTAAGAGDTINLFGNFGKMGLTDRSFATPLIINARNARFKGTLDVSNVRGLAFTGGTFGSTTKTWQNAGTIRVEDSSNIVFTSLKMIGDGKGKARGITFRDSDNVGLYDSTFNGFRSAAGVNNVTQGRISGNRVTASTSDGFNIVNSHFITASNNICSGGKPSFGAHPDCIQLWSIYGEPVQSDIRLLNNKAYGHTQGFTSFDPARGGGLRIEMSGNYVSSTLPQGIACYACVDSRFTNNVLVSARGASYQTRLNVIGGSNNYISNNNIGPRPVVNRSIFADTDLEMSGSAFEAFDSPVSRISDFAGSEAMASVPEVATWAQMLFGFGLTGALLRRRQLAGALSR